MGCGVILRRRIYAVMMMMEICVRGDFHKKAYMRRVYRIDCVCWVIYANVNIYKTLRKLFHYVMNASARSRIHKVLDYARMMLPSSLPPHHAYIIQLNAKYLRHHILI